MNVFVDSNAWTKVNHEIITDYFYGERRLSITKTDEKGTSIKKIRLENVDFDFQGSGFYIRICFSKEIPSKRFSIDKSEYKRIKERSSFSWKHLSFDLTKVESENNSISKINYEVEIEAKVIDYNKMTSHYFIHDLLLKIKDIVKICEPFENENNLKLICI